MATFAPPPNMLSPPNPFNVPQYPRGIAMQPPYAPTSSTTPPSATASPTFHTAHLHAKHIGRPKQPLYVPAVLRPTEMPPRTMPLTPPRSTNNSFDSASSARAISASHEQGALLGADSVLRVDRVVSDEWEDEALGDVTGLPTRNHWKPDWSASTCTDVACQQIFTIWSRRHHCRRCGNIFCASHVAHRVPLDQHARFHPDGITDRSCDSCWADYKTWKRARRSRGNSTVSSQEAATAATPSAPIGAGTVRGAQTEQKVGSVAVSVPRDWNWSTF
ncbi:Zn finger protein [Elasticomyces elasticus]|nr:Zn finger protein [Elasticomyces elasticus]KAK4987664.1 Zn finger protein [Elasticomyces elasticus]